ncbi:MAG: ABC transporter permease [Candidatus Geothermarchaeales archaeon]
MSVEVLIPVGEGMGELLKSYSEYVSGFVQIDTGVRSRDVMSQFFTSSDIAEILSIEGVRDVYRLLLLDSLYNISNETLAKMDPDLREEMDHIPDLSLVQFVVGLVGIQPVVATVAAIPYANIVEGRFIKPGETRTAVASIEVNEKLGLKIGDEAPLIISGEVVNFKLVGFFTMPPLPRQSYLFVTDLGEFLQLLDISVEEGSFNQLLVKPEEAEAAGEIVQQLKKTYPEASVHYEAQVIQAGLQAVESVLGNIRLTEILVFASSVGVIVAVRLLDVLRRRSEIGLYEAVGWKERHILVYELWYSLLVGFLGALVGVGLTVLAGGYLSAQLIPKSLMGTLVVPEIPSITSFIRAPVVAISLSTFAFVASYLYLRRLTPLKALGALE